MVGLFFLMVVIPAHAGRYPLQVWDQFGRPLTLQRQPERIISGSPGNTEILFALGLGDRVVGVTDWCDYPPEAKDKPKIGNISPLNLEKVISLRPDLLLACNLNGKEPVETLTELGVPTFVLNPISFSDIIEAVRLVGLITAAEAEAEKLAKKLEATIEAVTRKKAPSNKKLKVFIAIGSDLQDLWTAGDGTFLDEAARLLGWENIAGELGFSWGQVSMEYILKMNPDLILTELAPEVFQKDPFFGRLAAPRKKQVYQIDVNTFSRPGPRLIEALKDLASLQEKTF